MPSLPQPPSPPPPAPPPWQRHILNMNTECMNERSNVKRYLFLFIILKSQQLLHDNQMVSLATASSLMSPTGNI